MGSRAPDDWHGNVIGRHESELPNWPQEVAQIEHLDDWQQRVVLALACPIDWHESIVRLQNASHWGIVDAPFLAAWLYADWANWLVKHAGEWGNAFGSVLETCDIDGGDRPCNVDATYRGVSLVDLQIWDEEDSELLTRGILVARDVIETAREKYLNRGDVNFWRALKVLGHDTHPKHLAAEGLRDRSSTIANTNSSRTVGHVFESVRNGLPAALWFILDELAFFQRWDLLQKVSTDRSCFYMSFLGEHVGATEGQVSDILCFEITGSGRSCHAYPVAYSSLGTDAYLLGLSAYTDPVLVRAEAP